MRSLRSPYLGVILAMGVAGSGCAPQGTHPPAKSTERPPAGVPASPCDDRLYVALRDKELDAMTPREYEYFTRKDAECSAYRLRLAPGAADAPYRETTEWPRAAETARDSIPPPRHSGIGSGTVVGIVALSTLAAMVAVALMMSQTTIVVGW